MMSHMDPPVISFRAVYNTFLDVPQFSSPIEASVEGVTIVLRYPIEGELGYGSKDGDAICIATKTVQADERTISAFDLIAERRLPEGSEIPSAHPATVNTERLVEGNWAILREWLPQWLQDFIADVNSELHAATVRAVRIARWRLGLRASHKSIKSAQGATWSYEGETWRSVPSGLSVRIIDVSPPAPSDEMLNDISRLIEQHDTQEPLGHDLFREAWNQRNENLRSALILGMASAEARVKEFVISLEPGTAWLVENLTSPPLNGMLKNYIPELLVMHGIRTIPISPPKQPILAQLDNGMKLRNKIVHGIDRNLTIDTVEELLLSIRDVHWMLDVFSGHEWARRFVRHDVLSAWDPGC